ncbi:MAG: hypothetical protein ACI91B_003604, partial [Planctomycetota bacterium]
GRFCMLHAPGSSLSDAGVSFVGKDLQAGSWRAYEQPVTSEVAVQVAAQIDALGMPVRTPEVSPAFDTSDSWTNLLLWVKKDEQSISFEIGMQCSGFEGPDAEALRRLLHTLCSLCGYQGFDRSVLGSVVTPLAVGPVPPPETGSSSVWSTPKFCSACGHDVSEGGYPDGRRVPCPNGACQHLLPPPHSTCVSVACGHLAPMGSSFCWVCGVGLTTS